MIQQALLYGTPENLLHASLESQERRWAMAAKQRVTQRALLAKDVNMETGLADSDLMDYLTGPSMSLLCLSWILPNDTKLFGGN